MGDGVVGNVPEPALGRRIKKREEKGGQLVGWQFGSQWWSFRRA